MTEYFEMIKSVKQLTLKETEMAMGYLAPPVGKAVRVGSVVVCDIDLVDALKHHKESLLGD